MAEELWNKINIPTPSAVSVYRVSFSEVTGRLYDEQPIKITPLLSCVLCRIQSSIFMGASACVVASTWVIFSNAEWYGKGKGKVLC